MNFQVRSSSCVLALPPQPSESKLKRKGKIQRTKSRLKSVLRRGEVTNETLSLNNESALILVTPSFSQLDANEQGRTPRKLQKNTLELRVVPTELETAKSRKVSGELKMFGHLRKETSKLLPIIQPSVLFVGKPRQAPQINWPAIIHIQDLTKSITTEEISSPRSRRVLPEFSDDIKGQRMMVSAMRA